MQPWCRFASEAASHATESAAPSRAAKSGSGSEPFRTTSRWLRGRILDRLRDATGGTWVTFDESIGEHDPATVATALDRLARERLVELRGIAPIEARLPEA